MCRLAQWRLTFEAFKARPCWIFVSLSYVHDMAASQLQEQIRQISFKIAARLSGVTDSCHAAAD